MTAKIMFIGKDRNTACHQGPYLADTILGYIYVR